MSIVEKANIIRQKRKTIKIKLNADNQFYIYCPKNLSLKKLKEIVDPKTQYFEKKFENIKKTNQKFTKILSGEELLFLGSKYNIALKENLSKCYFDETTLYIPNNIDKRNYYIKKTLKTLCEKILPKRLSEVTKIFDKSAKKIYVGNFKSKWGSCDSYGTIKFNYKIIMLPYNLIDFIIYHEFTHLYELNHSTKFYNILSNVCPKYKKNKEELKTYSFILSLY